MKKKANFDGVAFKLASFKVKILLLCQHLSRHLSRCSTVDRELIDLDPHDGNLKYSSDLHKNVGLLLIGKTATCVKVVI